MLGEGVTPGGSWNESCTYHIKQFINQSSITRNTGMMQPAVYPSLGKLCRETTIRISKKVAWFIAFMTQLLDSSFCSAVSSSESDWAVSWGLGNLRTVWQCQRWTLRTSLSVALLANNPCFWKTFPFTEDNSLNQAPVSGYVPGKNSLPFGTTMPTSNLISIDWWFTLRLMDCQNNGSPNM